MSFAIRLEGDLRQAVGRNPDRFPRTMAVMRAWGERAVAEWIRVVEATYSQRGQPSWWIKNYLGPGGRNIRYRAGKGNPFEIEIYHDDSGSAYRYGSVIEGGRQAYDMKQLIGKSQRTRVFEKGHLRGVRYLVIPMGQGGDRQVDVKLTKTGEHRDDSGALRNVYSKEYRRQGASAAFFEGGRDSVASFTQVDKLGRARAVNVEFAIMHERSTESRWIYPRIPAVKYSEMVATAIENGRIKMNVGGEPKSFGESVAICAYLDMAAGVA